MNGFISNFSSSNKPGASFRKKRPSRDERPFMSNFPSSSTVVPRENILLPKETLIKRAKEYLVRMERQSYHTAMTYARSDQDRMLSQLRLQQNLGKDILEKRALALLGYTDERFLPHGYDTRGKSDSGYGYFLTSATAVQSYDPILAQKRARRVTREQINRYTLARMAASKENSRSAA